MGVTEESTVAADVVWSVTEESSTTIGYAPKYSTIKSMYNNKNETKAKQQPLVYIR